MEVVASAPAKVILFGEHFVVYGTPAIALAIDKRAYVRAENRSDQRLYIRSLNLHSAAYFEDGTFKIEKGDAKEARPKFEPIKLAVEKILKKHGDNVGVNIEIDSSIPIGAGLGSSAAVIAAAAAAVGELLNIKLTKENLFHITCEGEKVVHGTPSGIDSAISVFGGTLLFRTDKGFNPLDYVMNIPIVVGDTGVERPTRVQVEKMREIREKYPKVVEPIMLAAGEIVVTAIEAFKKNDLNTLGRLMNINQGLLAGLGVSDESLERLINAARKAGALGAKLTGAGGGGCMIALARNEDLEHVLKAIHRAGGKSFVARNVTEGVKIEST